MRPLIFALTSVVMLFSALAAFAAEPQPHPRWAGPFGRAPVAPSSKHAAIGAYGRAMYPKYYFGLHAREFQNAGLPHGDIGILGSGLTRNPW